MTRMIWNFEYLIVFTCASGVLPEQNDRYRIQPWKGNEIKVYKNFIHISSLILAGPLGLMGRQLARQTSEPSSNPSGDATVHSVCEIFNVMCVV